MDVAAATDALTEADLRARGSLKWSAAAPGVIAAWVAEMDLPLAPTIREALADALGRGLTGYLPEWAAERAREATAAWQGRYGRTVDPADVHLVPDVLGALRISADHLVPQGTPIVLPTPAYMPFLDLPAVVDRSLVLVPMREDDGRYRLDCDAIAAALTPGALLLLTNPHNPTGRVFTAGELAELAEVVDRAGAFVFADEIHAPLVFPGHHHVAYATVSAAAAAHTVTATSASKGWNLPGLACAQIILAPQFAGPSWETVPFLASHGVSPLGAVAAAAAYTDGADHLAAVLQYLDWGFAGFAQELADALPTARFRIPEGTYLGWVDLRATPLDPATAEATAGVRGVDGTACGAPGFLRLNLATPHPLLRELAVRLGRAARE